MNIDTVAIIISIAKLIGTVIVIAWIINWVIGLIRKRRAQN